MKKFYVISFEDGTTKWAEDADYNETLHHAEYCKNYEGCGEYTIEEYDSYEDYLNNC